MAATLKVDIVTDADTRGIDQAESRLSSFGSKAAKFGKLAAVGLAGAGIAAVGVGVKLFQMGDDAADANDRIRSIAGSMDLFGGKVDKVSNRLVKYAERTARQTGLDTNSIKATQAKLLTFGELASSADKVGGNFDRATQAAIDLAAAGFGTAESNAAQLGKALNDPVKGLASLTKSGVTFTEAEKARIATLVESNKMGEAQAMVLRAIEKQVGGTAKSMAGGFDRMRVTATQLGEKLGQQLLPYVDRFGNFVVDKALPAAIRFGNTMREKLGPSLSAVGTFITQRAVPALVSLYGWFVDKIVPGIVKYVTPVIAGLRSGFARVSAAVSDNEPQLRKIGEALKKVAEFVAQKVMPVLGTLIGEGFKALGNVIGTVVDGIGTFVDGIGGAIDKIQELIDWIGRIDFPDFPDIDIPGLGAAGGLYRVQGELVGPSPSFDTRRGWSSAAAGTPSLALAMRNLSASTSTAGVVDARTYLTVQVDGSGVVDEHRVAQAIAAMLARYFTRLGRPITGLPFTV